MLSKWIGASIHKVIRDEKMSNIIDSLVDDKVNVFDFYIDKIKKFLSQEEFFDKTISKYIVFLRFLKKELKISNEKKLAENSSKIYDIYALPNKKNNFFLIFLLYFYLNNKDIRKEKEIFKIIYLYYLVIVYRNELPMSLREKIVDIDKLKFHSLADITKNKILLFFHKIYSFIIKRFRVIASLAILISLIFVFYKVNVNYLSADITSEVSTDTLSQIIYWWFVFDDSASVLADVFNDSFSSFTSSTFYNLFMMVIILFLVQSFKDTFKDSLKDSQIFAMFTYLGTLVKKLINIILYIYNSVISYFGTKFIFWFVDTIIRFRINISSYMLVLVVWMYVALNFAVIYMYVFLFHFFIWLWIFQEHMIILTVILSFFIMYINFNNNMLNFKKFMKAVEGYLWYATKQE